MSFDTQSEHGSDVSPRIRLEAQKIIEEYNKKVVGGCTSFEREAIRFAAAKFQKQQSDKIISFKKEIGKRRHQPSMQLDYHFTERQITLLNKWIDMIFLGEK